MTPQNENNNDKEITTALLTNTSRPNGLGSVGIDVDYYQEIIDDPEVSPARKRELIEIIVTIARNFVDLGFGVHPVQLATREHEERHDIQQPAKEKILERSDV